jgi:hypothetical protein
MSEVTDIVVPILQRLQIDLGEVKRDLGEVNRRIEALTDRMDAFLAQRHTLDIRRLRQKIAAINARLNGPEGQQ